MSYKFEYVVNNMKIIDAHVHCGNSRLAGAKYYPKDQMWEELREVNASGAVILAFPEDIYRNENTLDQRNAANAYILSIAEGEPDVHPLYTVWTDYVIPENLDQYAGIKWHRHANEPAYDYDCDACEAFLGEMKRLALPVLLEEEFDNTASFIERNPELTVIIPHLGESNGGEKKMDVFFDNPKVFFDTAITNANELRRFYEAVGPERLIFGTDYSACRQYVDNSLPTALRRHADLGLPDAELEMIYSGTIERLLGIRA